MEENKNKKQELLKAFERFLYNEKNKTIKSETLISIDGHRVASLGNLLGIAGPPKCGKSSLAGAIIAGCLNPGQQNDIDCLGLEISPNTGSHEIIYINTEFGQGDFNAFIEKVLIRAKLKEQPSFFHALNLTGLRPKELLMQTDNFVRGISQFNKVRLLLIDGIADYVNNILDPKECISVTEYFLDLAKTYNLLVAEVIHKNPGKGETKSRGHIGSDISRKCEATIELKPAGKSVTISASHLRNSSPHLPIRVMVYDVEKGYFISGGNNELSKPARREVKVDDTPERVKRLFKDRSPLKYGELAVAVMDEYKVKIDAAKKRIKSFVEDEKLIIKSTKGDGYLLKE